MEQILLGALAHLSSEQGLLDEMSALGVPNRFQLKPGKYLAPRIEVHVS